MDDILWSIPTIGVSLMLNDDDDDDDDDDDIWYSGWRRRAKRSRSVF